METKMKKGVAPRDWIVLVLVILLLGFLAIPPSYFRDSLRKELTTEINEVRQVKLACDLYAVDHEGQYPAILEELFQKNYLDDSDRVLVYKKGALRWNYISGLRNDSAGETVILESIDFLNDSKAKATARVNGSCSITK